MALIMATEHTAAGPVTIVPEIYLSPQNRIHHIRIEVNEMGIVGRITLGIAYPMGIVTNTAGSPGLHHVEVVHIILHIVSVFVK